MFGDAIRDFFHEPVEIVGAVILSEFDLSRNVTLVELVEFGPIPVKVLGPIVPPNVDNSSIISE